MRLEETVESAKTLRQCTYELETGSVAALDLPSSPAPSTRKGRTLRCTLLAALVTTLVALLPVSSVAEGFDPVDTLGVSHGISDTPLLGVAADGTAFIAGRRGTDQAVRVWERPISGSNAGQWVTAEPLDETMLASFIGLSVPPSGTPRLVVFSSLANELRVYVRSAEATWVLEESESMNAPSNFAIGSNSDGDAVIAYYDNASIYIWRRDASTGTWDSPRAAEPAASVQNLHVAVDESGAARLFYIDTLKVKSIFVTDTGLFGSPVVMFDPTYDFSRLSVHADPDSGALAVVAAYAEPSSDNVIFGHGSIFDGVTGSSSSPIDNGGGFMDLGIAVGVVPGSGLRGGSFFTTDEGQATVNAAMLREGNDEWDIEGSEGPLDSGGAFPGLGATRLAGGSTLIVTSTHDSALQSGIRNAFILHEDGLGQGPVPAAGGPLDTVFGAAGNVIVRADAQGNAIASWIDGAGNLKAVFYDGPAPSGGGTSGGGTSGSGGSSGGEGTGGSSGGGSGGGAGGSSGSGSGGGSSAGGGSGAGGGTGTGGGTESGGGPTIGPVSPAIVPRAPEIVVSGNDVTIRFQQFSGVAESAQKRKKKKNRRAARLLRMIAAMTTDDGVSASAVRAYAKRNNLSFEYEVEISRPADRANRVKAKKIKKTTKKNEITLRDLESGRYSTRYRVRITDGRGKKKKNVASTKWSPSTDFNIA